MNLKNDLDHYRLGVTDAALLCTDAEDGRAVTVAMINQCERWLDIFSSDLEPSIYDDPDCCEAVEALALRSRHARIRILVREPHTVARRGHGLVRLGQRLSSFIQFRRPADEHMGISDRFMLAHTQGVIHRPYGDSLKAHANFCDPAQARHLGNLFQQVWDRGEPAPDLRPLFL